MNKDDNSYKTISEVVKILNLKSKKVDTLPTHTLRFWEKEFKQIKPKIFSGKRRYYDEATVDKLKEIKYLLKDKGLTIKGAKKFLNNETSSIDEQNNSNINSLKNLKSKILKISNLVKSLKK